MIARLMRARQERRFIASAFVRLAPGLVRSLQRPTVGEMLAGSRDLPSVLNDLCPDWASYLAEVEEVRREIERRYLTQAIAFPREFSVESATETLLYALVRSRKPRVVLETGVANGHGTVILLAALRRNGVGELHSTDVLADAGSLLNADERQEWRFHRLRVESSRAAFFRLLSELGSVDLFFHDSEHTYGWQTFEYEAVLPVLTRTGCLVTDDADASYAFLDFCSRHMLTPVTFLDHHKVIGLVQSH